MIRTILLTGANGDLALSSGRALELTLPHVRLFGSDMEGEWPGRTVFAEVLSVLPADDQAYLESLQAAVEMVGADLVLPCTEPELRHLAEVDTGGLDLLMNSSEVVLRCLDKYETASWLEALGLPFPRTCLLGNAKASDLPVIVKPCRGSGSRGCEIITTARRLEVVQEENEDAVVAQELLEPHEGEFTCAVFKAHGEVRTLTMRRWLTGGLTGRMIVEEIPSITEVLLKIAENLPKLAAINIQLRLVKGVPFVFEINPRLSSTVMMRSLIGFSDASWWVEALAGRKPPVFAPPCGVKVFRIYSERVLRP